MILLFFCFAIFRVFQSVRLSAIFNLHLWWFAQRLLTNLSKICCPTLCCLVCLVNMLYHYFSYSNILTLSLSLSLSLSLCLSLSLSIYLSICLYLSLPSLFIFLLASLSIYCVSIDRSIYHSLTFSLSLYSHLSKYPLLLLLFTFFSPLFPRFRLLCVYV